MNVEVKIETEWRVRRFESAIDGKVKQPIDGYIFVVQQNLESIRIIETASGKEMGRYPMRHISYIEWE